MRKALGVRTIFNMIGPLTNPAGATTQLTGVYNGAITELVAGALKELGVKRAMVVHSEDGMDEISCNVPTRVSELKDGLVTTYDLEPSLYLDGFEGGEIGGGTPDENAKILLDVLEGRDRGANRAVTLINSGAAIYIYGLAKDIQEGVKMAEESIDKGFARQKLDELIAASKNA